MKTWQAALAAVVIAADCGSAFAQSNASVPPWHGRWRLSSTSPTPKAVTVWWGLDPACDDDTARAAASWNNAGSNFKFQAPQVSEINQDAPDDPYMLGSYWIRENDLETGVIMRAHWDAAPSANSALDTIYGALVRVNTDYLYYGTDEQGMFYCGSPDTLDSQNQDYESVMLHELAHNFGFRHASDPNCPMWPEFYKGYSRRFLCPDEAQGFRDLYNPAVTPYD